MQQERSLRAKYHEPAHDEDDGERLSCEECGESFNVNESGNEDRCPRCA